MAKLLSINSLYLVLLFIVPGFIALSVRSQFVAGRDPSDNKTALLSYLTVSVIYGAFTLIFVDPTAIRDSFFAWVGFVFVGPILLIAAGEIRTVEFWPYTPQEEPDEQG